ncbi:arylamine N-acetyltransferase [Tsukamurella sp. 1534]|uniref:arylamine N-acetyltransferase family protein n=1 Tax=Tsukamurella sp. 1534 TaxID=1151061 RepID=UPI00030E6CEE|nr:arylamine N-acetyltransferase [Tsukamurella sp. 1534]
MSTVAPTTTVDIDAYLHRLGLAHRPPPTLETLRDLQLRHVATFPFETLATAVGAPVDLSPAALSTKILTGRRGGYCYELNGLFLWLLQALGFDARPLTGWVVIGAAPDDWESHARTHQLTLVHLDGARHITDVGLGGMVPTGPLLLDGTGLQATPHEHYSVTPVPTSVTTRYLLRQHLGDTARPLYVFDLAEQRTVDLHTGNWYVSTHPDSPFRGAVMAARAEPGRRHVLAGADYAVHRVGAATERRALTSVEEIVRVLDDAFGIDVGDDAAVRAVLAAQLAD